MSNTAKKKKQEKKAKARQEKAKLARAKLIQEKKAERESGQLQSSTKDRQHFTGNLKQASNKAAGPGGGTQVHRTQGK